MLVSSLINEEIATSKRALDLTLGAYNEFQMALPLHLRYMRIVRELEKYRDKLGEIRWIIEAFPKILPNATTTQCT